MKKSLLLISLCAFSVSLFAQNQAYLDYIEQWKQTAVDNQAEYGIPASIIMAQALLESGAGQSELALNANNHFGIKCNNEWMGAVYYYDDDSQGECFRQYSNAAESFRDHALFLQRPRYQTCYEIVAEDYEGWAYRLKECGYATDKNYAPKLIKIIQDYRLDTLVAYAAVGTYQPMTPVDVVYDQPTAQQQHDNSITADSLAAANEQEQKLDTTSSANTPKRPLKAVVVRKTEPIMVINNEPEPELVIPLSAREERKNFMLLHPKKRFNGINYVIAREGDTYANVAFRLNIRERDLRENNDALGREMEAGDRIYLAPKKKKGTKDYVLTHPGQSLWQLSQDEGVTIESIQKLNELDITIRTFRTRQKLYLKKVKDDGVR